MKITVIIPAKGTSERVNNKNLYEINGKSLVYRACEKCLKSKLITSVYIDTESEKIIENVKDLIELGLKVIKRPIEMATNKTSGNDLIAFEYSNIEPCDLVLHTYSTSPLITEKTIDNCLEKFLQNWQDYDSFFSATPFQEYIWDNSGNPINFSIEQLPNSVDLPKIWLESHGLYGIKYHVLGVLKRRLGNKTLPIEIPREESLDINYESDIKILENIWNQ